MYDKRLNDLFKQQALIGGNLFGPMPMIDAAERASLTTLALRGIHANLLKHLETSFKHATH
tara:strand:- start:176 stop:358 length:183 start_codon:yes stop_codon:yes gene_type:complete